MTNSADPDQKPTDLDLHCLLRQGMSCSAREGLIRIMFCSVYSLTDQIVALKEIRIQPEEGVPFTAIREGKSLTLKAPITTILVCFVICL